MRSSWARRGFEMREPDAATENVFHGAPVAARTMNATRTTPIDPGYRIQLPAEWADALGLKGRVLLTRTVEGILVRPCPQATWDEIFATKLTIRSANPSDDPEVTEDDLLF
jgi:hypothetical protein